MDSGLKERLVGAAVLVALGVWLIPWILDGRGSAEVDSTDEVALPVTDAPVRTQTRTIPLDEGMRGATGQPDAAPSKTNVPNAAGVSSAPVTDAVPAAAPSPAERMPAAASDSAENGTEAGAAPPPAEAEAPRRETPAASVQDGWFVQLGSFGEADNARRLAGRVATFGYRAEVSTYRSGGRTLNRVRVGPSATREEAEAVASSLSAHGFVAQVVSAD